MKKSIQNTLKFIGLIIFILLAVILVRYLQSTGIVSLMSLREALEGYGMFAPIIFILIYIILTIIFFPGLILSITSGVLFGTFLGTIYTVIGAVIGATIVFSLSRYLGRSFVHEMIEKKYPKIKEYDKKLEKDGMFTVLFLRFIPIFPFTGLNLSLGLTKLRLKDYFIGTLIGIIPGSFAFAYFGDSITELNILNISLSVLLLILLIFSYKIYKFLRK